MPNFNLTYQNDGENEQLYYKDAHNNDLYIRSCEDFAPAIIQEKSGNPITLTDAANCPVRKLKVTFEPTQEGSGDPSPDNVRPITGRDSVTVTRTSVNVESATIPFGQTVYGGTVDVTTGKLTVTDAMVDLGSLQWTKFNNYNYGTFVSDSLSNCAYSATQIFCMCDTYKAESTDSASKTEDKYIWIRNPNWVVIKDTILADEGMTAEEFKTAMSGKVFVYKLETPQIIQFTPAQLSTLKGENTFSTDGTSIELEYVVDTKTYIDNLINSGKKTVVKPNDEIKIIDENTEVE